MKRRKDADQQYPLLVERRRGLKHSQYARPDNALNWSDELEAYLRSRGVALAFKYGFDKDEFTQHLVVEMFPLIQIGDIESIACGDFQREKPLNKKIAGVAVDYHRYERYRKHEQIEDVFAVETQMPLDIELLEQEFPELVRYFRLLEELGNHNNVADAMGYPRQTLRELKAKWLKEARRSLEDSERGMPHSSKYME